MPLTRSEIAALLKRSELNLLKTQEIHRELQALMADVECVLKSQPTVNRTVQE